MLKSVLEKQQQFIMVITWGGKGRGNKRVKLRNREAAVHVFIQGQENAMKALVTKCKLFQS